MAPTSRGRTVGLVSPATRDDAHLWRWPIRRPPWRQVGEPCAAGASRLIAPWTIRRQIERSSHRARFLLRISPPTSRAGRILAESSDSGSGAYLMALGVEDGGDTT